jgi:hypothetical protein
MIAIGGWAGTPLSGSPFQESFLHRMCGMVNAFVTQTYKHFQFVEDPQIRNGSVAAQAVSGDIEDALWLVPIEDRQRQGSLRKGIVEGFTLGQYLLLVDYTSRMVRKGKAVVSSELEGIFERLQSSAEIWSQRIKRLHEKTWIGRFLSASRDRLRGLASKLGVRHLANIG